MPKPDKPEAYDDQELALWNGVWSFAFVRYLERGALDDEAALNAADTARRAVVAHRKVNRRQG